MYFHTSVLIIRYCNAIDLISMFAENHRASGGKSSISGYYTTVYGRAVFDNSLRERWSFVITVWSPTRPSPRWTSFPVATCWEAAAKIGIFILRLVPR